METLKEIQEDSFEILKEVQSDSAPEEREKK